MALKGHLRVGKLQSEAIENKGGICRILTTLNPGKDIQTLLQSPGETSVKRHTEVVLVLNDL